MASKAANTAEVAETREEAAEAPLLDSLAAAIKRMLARGKERGYLTYDELNAALPPDQVSSEQIEDTMTMLSELGINVIENEESEEPAAAEADEGDGEVRGNLDDDDIGRTDDPVRMYLREMGSVELLSREGEIAIAKRIEAGREMMIGGICENPMTIRAIIGWRDALNEGKMLLRDIIDLDADLWQRRLRGGAAEMRPSRPTEAAARRGWRRPRCTQPEEPRGGRGQPSELGEIESELAVEEAEGEESSISLAAMEAQLKPSALATFDAIAETYKRLHRLQDQRINALQKGEPLPRVTERRYEKLQGGNHRKCQARAPQQHAHRVPRRAALRSQPQTGRRRRAAVAAGRKCRGQALGFPAGIFRQRAGGRLAASVSRSCPAAAGPS